MRRLFSRLFDSGVHVSCSNICVTLSNIPYLPFTKRAALRCTISSLSELYFWRGCQTVALYSRKDLTREKYAVSLSFSGQPFRLRLRKDNLEFALDVMTSMCFVHSKSSLTVTPRYLASFTSSSTCPDNSYWYGMGVCFLDTLIILHLAALNLIPHVDPQLSSKFRSFCRSF